MNIKDTKNYSRSTDPLSRSTRKRLAATSAYGTEREAEKALAECPFVEGERANLLMMDNKRIDSEVIFRGLAFIYGKPFYLVSKIGPDGEPFKAKRNVPMGRIAKIEQEDES